ncbi:MAG: ROK family protein [Gammaproteobacteria bacterium]|nr:MAG: ROK family protein [Gammaproteobacteria bacterium]
MGTYAIGIDIGGTRMKCGAVSPSGKILAQHVVPSNASRGTRGLLKGIAETVNEFERRLGKPAGIGLGLSGVVDPEFGVRYLPGKFKGLEGFDIVPRLRKRLGVPVWADNDGLLAMLAEHRFGQAKQVKWAATLTIGTGVGSGVILDGRILREPSFLFGTQIGHCVLQNYGGKYCLTTARGTAETLCSCTALALSVRDGLQRGIPSILTDLYWKDAHAIDFKKVIEGVRKKDKLCLDEFDRWVHNLGCLLVTVTHAYTPQMIILSGGGANAADLYLTRLKKHIHHNTFRYPPDRRIRLVTSRLADMAGVLGGAAHVWSRLS